MSLFLKSISQFKKLALVALALPALSACGQMNDLADGGAGTVDADEAAESAAAVAGSVFGGGSGAQNLTVPSSVLNRYVTLALESQQGSPYQNDESYTCASLDEEDSGPDGILMESFGEPGLYGSDNEPIDVAAEDFCTLPDGTPNTGTGPDGRGRLATFEITEDVTFSCTGEDISTIVMQSGSTGVWRNTTATEDEPAYMPQIFGTFSYLVDGTTEITLDCTIYLGEDEEIVFADCSNEAGEAVVQESDTGCSFDEGAEAQNDDEDQYEGEYDNGQYDEWDEQHEGEYEGEF